jgi:hypothetical protein
MSNDPQPLSSTASGGKIIDNITLNSDIVLFLSFINQNLFPHISANPMPKFQNPLIYPRYPTENNKITKVISFLTKNIWFITK